MKVVYFDCFSGISGDMTLAALIDAGANMEYIEQELNKIPIEPFTFEYRKVVKKGITALKIEILLDPDVPISHRFYTDITHMIDQSDLVADVKRKAKKIFEIIAQAKAKVHHIPLDKLPFHGAGAIHTIVNIIGISLALEDLNIEQIFTSPLPLGVGQMIKEQNIYPIPTPTTLEILKGIPIRSCSIQSEMTTSTGAAIIAALGQDFEGYPSMTIDSIGYGAGSKDFNDRPNVLRAVVGKTHQLYITEGHFHIHEHSQPNHAQQNHDYPPQHQLK